MVRPLRYTVLVLLAAILSLPKANAQLFKWLYAPCDSNYISSHAKDLTVRLYGSSKYVYYTLRDEGEHLPVRYRPNNKLIFGFGFAYKIIGINVGFNFPSINNDNEKYGDTRYFDFQSHLYFHRMTVDFWGQYYKGFYIANPSDVLISYAGQPQYPKRDDLQLTNVGLDVQYIFNYRKFSFRAAFLQNEYQKKSAGSLILSGTAFTTFVNADSSLIPGNIKPGNFFDGFPFSHSNVYSITANVGYAYTVVIKRHFFITGAAVGGVGINYTVMKYDAVTKDAAGLQLNSIIRAAAGYNSERFYLGAQFVGTFLRANAPFALTRQNFGAGNIRITAAYRFKLKRNYLAPIDKFLY